MSGSLTLSRRAKQVKGDPRVTDSASSAVMITRSGALNLRHWAEQVKGDPRVTVRLGTPISAYGQESRNRAARQRIPHRAWTDGSGVEHHQVRDCGMVDSHDMWWYGFREAHHRV